MYFKTRQVQSRTVEGAYEAEQSLICVRQPREGDK